MLAPRFETFVARRIEAIDLCIEKELFVEGLTLLYAGIDACA